MRIYQKSVVTFVLMVASASSYASDPTPLLHFLLLVFSIPPLLAACIAYAVTKGEKKKKLVVGVSTFVAGYLMLWGLLYLYAS